MPGIILVDFNRMKPFFPRGNEEIKLDGKEVNYFDLLRKVGDIPGLVIDPKFSEFPDETCICRELFPFHIRGDEDLSKKIRSNLKEDYTVPSLTEFLAYVNEYSEYHYPKNIFIPRQSGLSYIGCSGSIEVPFFSRSLGGLPILGFRKIQVESRERNLFMLIAKKASK